MCCPKLSFKNVMTNLDPVPAQRTVHYVAKGHRQQQMPLEQVSYIPLSLLG